MQQICEEAVQILQTERGEGIKKSQSYVDVIQGRKEGKGGKGVNDLLCRLAESASARAHCIVILA